MEGEAQTKHFLMLIVQWRYASNNEWNKHGLRRRACNPYCVRSAKVHETRRQFYESPRKRDYGPEN